MTVCSFKRKVGQSFIVLALILFGTAFVFLDIFFFGTIFLAVLGVIFLATGIWWSGLDIWPNIPLSLEDLIAPLVSLGHSLLVLLILILLGWHLGLFKKGLNYLTLKTSVKLSSDNTKEPTLEGEFAETLTVLMPSGKIKCQNKILEAHAIQGNIEANEIVKIIRKKDFVWLVEKTNTKI